jgi:hypothetical protein
MASQPDIRITMATEKQHFWIDREHNRITTEIPCKVGQVGGKRLNATIINLSMGGLKFACSQEIFNLLIPEQQRTPGQVIDVSIDIHFQLPAADRKKPLSIRNTGRVIHTERLAQDIYHLGVQFTILREAEIRGIENHIKQVASQRLRW